MILISQQSSNYTKLEWIHQKKEGPKHLIKGTYTTNIRIGSGQVQQKLIEMEMDKQTTIYSQ